MAVATNVKPLTAYYAILNAIAWPAPVYLEYLGSADRGAHTELADLLVEALPAILKRLTI